MTSLLAALALEDHLPSLSPFQSDDKFDRNLSSQFSPDSCVLTQSCHMTRSVTSKPEKSANGSSSFGFYSFDYISLCLAPRVNKSGWLYGFPGPVLSI